MANKPNLTPEQLRQLFRYDPDTGALFWRPRDATWAPLNMKIKAETWAKRWNTKFAGKDGTYTDTSNGYAVVSLFNRTCFAHRIAWSVYYGEAPPRKIDHINGNRADNRICNIRSATDFENARNTRNITSVQGKHTSSRYRGVYLDKRRGRWIASIRFFRPGIGSKRKAIGSFKCETAAALAYDTEAVRLHGEFATLNLR